jgi:hypothetical protein
MKKALTAIFGAITLVMCGCSSTHHSSQKWEYKAVLTPLGPEGTRPVSIERRQQFLNELGKDGWVLVTADADLFYLKRTQD